MGLDSLDGRRRWRPSFYEKVYRTFGVFAADLHRLVEADKRQKEARVKEEEVASDVLAGGGPLPVFGRGTIAREYRARMEGGQKAI